MAIHFAVTHDLLTEETASIEDEADIVVGLEAIRDHLREDGPEVGYGLLRDQLFSAAAHGLDFVGPVPVGTEEELAIGVTEAAASGSTCGSSANSTPIAKDDLYIAGKEHVLTVAPDGVLTNDCEALNLPNTAHLYNGLTTQHGTLSLQTNGGFTFTPATGYAGSDGFFYRAYGNGQWSNVAFVEIVVIGVDIDIDSDNNGLLERSTAEDTIEMNNPGKILVATNPPQPRQPFTISLDGAGGLTAGELGGHFLTLQKQNQNVLIWESATGTGVPLTYMQASYLFNGPKTFYLEGAMVGTSHIDLILTNSSAAELHRDQIKISVVHLDIMGFRPQTEGVLYGDPFQRFAVPANQQTTPGVGIRKNTDDDDGNGIVDNLYNGALISENDLIETQITVTQMPGVQFRLKRTNTNLDVWLTWSRGAFTTAMLRGTATSAIITQNGTVSAWAEWIDRTPSQASTTLSLEVLATNSGNVVYSESMKFFPFKSIVMVLGGEFQEHPADPPEDPDEGMFYLAIDIYRNMGYDVHMHDEDDVYYAYPEGGGPVFHDIASAINQRGVTNVAVIGYSHGGGSVYDLLEEMQSNPNGIITTPYTVPMTSYVDGIVQEGWWAIRNRPPLSLFHLNQYQRNGSAGSPLMGNSLLDAIAGDHNADMSYLGVDHGTIDDHTIVKDIIKISLNLHVPR